MKVRNLTKRTILTKKLIIPNEFERMVGNIGKSRPAALLLKTRFGIHTFGVRFPLDIIILDNQNKVVLVKQSLEPNRIFLWHPKYTAVLELPEYTIHKSHTKIKDCLEFV